MWKQLLFCSVFLLPPGFASASTLKADLSGGLLRWENVNRASGSNNYVPSQWRIVDGLTPTESWTPGGLANGVPSTLTLNSGQDSVVVPFEVVGFEYNTGSANPSQGSQSTGASCGDSSLNAGIVRVLDGIGCTFPRTLMHTMSVNPYSFIRPIIHLDPIVLSDAFKGHAEGVYRGNVSVTNFYDYQFSSVRTRHNATHQVALEITYEPAFITSVDLNGDSELRTVYDLVNDVVSGETLFNGSVSGWFSNGVSLSLLPTRTDYVMNGPNNTDIPYTIECLGCENRALVESGSVVNAETVIPGVDVSQLNFNVRVSFQGIDLDSIESGRYSDTFVLVFEPNL